MKIKSHFVGKILWLFYLIFMSYLIFTGESSGFKWVYTIFLILAGIMMIWDSAVRAFIWGEKAKVEASRVVGKQALLRIGKIKTQLEQAYESLATSNGEERDNAKKLIKELKQELKEASEEASNY